MKRQQKTWKVMRAMLTLTEFAHFARISYRTVLRLTKTGELRTIRIGRTHRVPEEELRRRFPNLNPDETAR